MSPRLSGTYVSVPGCHVEGGGKKCLFQRCAQLSACSNQLFLGDGDAVSGLLASSWPHVAHFHVGICRAHAKSPLCKQLWGCFMQTMHGRSAGSNLGSWDGLGAGSCLAPRSLTLHPYSMPGMGKRRQGSPCPCLGGRAGGGS